MKPANALSLPVKIITAISLSSSNASRPCTISDISSSQREFIALGRLSWISPILLFSPLFSVMMCLKLWSCWHPTNERLLQSTRIFPTFACIDTNFWGRRLGAAPAKYSILYRSIGTERSFSCPNNLQLWYYIYVYYIDIFACFARSPQYQNRSDGPAKYRFIV